jgi:hypothetical protein
MKEKPMKKCLILVSSLLLVCCATGPAPSFPEDLKDYYALLIKGEPIPADFQRRVSNVESLSFSVETMEDNSARCLHFEIATKHPVRLKYISEVEIKKCHLVGGFVPRDTQSFFNWVDDAWDWMETRKRCFK